MDLPRDFGTIIADPPWAYDRSRQDERLRGYSTDKHYPALSTAELAKLPVKDYTGPDAVLLLWTTWPFLADALAVMEAWGFQFVTGLPWVKVTSVAPVGHTLEGETAVPIWQPTYGVGYWMRGCTEPILLGKKGKAVRTPYVGLVSENFRHSRKPDSLYELAEGLAIPGPRLEMFARRPREGWWSIGNEVEGDGLDIRERLQ